MGPKWITTSQPWMMVNTFIGFAIISKNWYQHSANKSILKLWAGEQKTAFAFGGAESSYHGCLKLSSLLGEGLPKIQQ